MNFKADTRITHWIDSRNGTHSDTEPLGMASVKGPSH